MTACRLCEQEIDDDIEMCPYCGSTQTEDEAPPLEDRPVGRAIRVAGVFLLLNAPLVLLSSFAVP